MPVMDSAVAMVSDGALKLLGPMARTREATMCRSARVALRMMGRLRDYRTASYTKRIAPRLRVIS